MISASVLYGNSNWFTIDLPETLKLGHLIGIYPAVINKRPADILYITICGHIVGQHPYTFDRCLGDCDIVDKRVMSHIILRSTAEDIRYPEIELMINSRNMSWYRNNPFETEVSETGATGIDTFLRALGNFSDVPIVITDDQYTWVITQMAGEDESLCSICQSANDSDTSVTLSCGHSYHNSCIHTWLTTSSVRCPTCNYDVRDTIV